MPEYRCVNIGVDGYAVWLTLSEKATIAAIEPTAYSETGQCQASVYALLTTVTLVVAGCCVEVKSPLGVDSVCRILGFVWDEEDVLSEKETTALKAAQPKQEDDKTEGGPQ